jgi:hypothetical protein
MTSPFVLLEIPCVKTPNHAAPTPVDYNATEAEIGHESYSPRDKARRIAADIAKLPKLLNRS